MHSNTLDTPDIKSYKYKTSTNKYFEGIINNLERRYIQTKSNYIRDWVEKYMSKHDCHQCKGNRLNNASLAVTINDLDISSLTRLTTKKIKVFLLSSKLTPKEIEISQDIIKEIKDRMWKQMNRLINHNGLTRMSNNYCEDILVDYLDNKNFENQITTLSSQFKEKFDVSLMGNITFFNDRFKDEYRIMEDNYGI